jgi:hypothetical protein
MARVGLGESDACFSECWHERREGVTSGAESSCQEDCHFNIVCVGIVLQSVGSETSVNKAKEHVFRVSRSRRNVQVEVLFLLVRSVVDLAEWSDGYS